MKYLILISTLLLTTIYANNNFLSIKGNVLESKCRTSYPNEHQEKCYIAIIQKVINKNYKKEKIYIYTNGNFENFIKQLSKNEYINMKCKLKNKGEYYKCQKITKQINNLLNKFNKKEDMKN